MAETTLHSPLSSKRPRIILDCDPGVDDSMAIITAARWTDLVGITSVAGNVELEHTTANACRMRELLGLDVEIRSMNGWVDAPHIRDRTRLAEPTGRPQRPTAGSPWTPAAHTTV